MATVVSNTLAEQKIKEYEPFRNKTGTLRGVVGPHRGADFGYLPDRYKAIFREALYVVYSYDTPIGAVTKTGERFVPDVGYSPSTGQHQYIVLHAWEIRRWPERGRETVKIPPTHTQYDRPRRMRRGGMDGESDQTLNLHWEHGADAYRSPDGS